MSPDTYLSVQIDQEPDAFVTIVQQQAAAWGSGKPVAELIDAYARAKASVFADKARDLLGI